MNAETALSRVRFDVLDDNLNVKSMCWVVIFTKLCLGWLLGRAENVLGGQIGLEESAVGLVGIIYALETFKNLIQGIVEFGFQYWAYCSKLC